MRNLGILFFLMKRVRFHIISLFLALIAVVPVYAQQRHRILVSTDIGGTDPDDNQSMVHLLMYSDLFDIEGLVSTASFGAGSKEEILRMIDLYACDYPGLSANYTSLKSPDALRAIAKQGSKKEAPLCGYGKPTEGSEWIVKCARRNDNRPLWVLVWGCLEDVAQALHDAPDIATKIRVNWIGGPNKKWGTNSYNYIVTNFPDLWIIEDNASYRGFIGSEKDDSFYGAPFWNNCMDGHGAMAKEYIKWYNGNSKMGDTPTLLYLMGQGFDSDKPDSPHWGGQFERIEQSPKYIITGKLCQKDTVACYSLMEWRLKGPKLEKSKDKHLKAMKDSICFIMRTDKQDWRGYYEGNGIYVVRYSPKAPATLTYTITSSIKGFPVHDGVFVVGNKWPAVNEYHCYSRCITPTPVILGKTWWSDAADASLMSGVSDDTSQGGGDYSALNGKWQGAGTIARWRNDVMRDWTERFSKIITNE